MPEKACYQLCMKQLRSPISRLKLDLHGLSPAERVALWKDTMRAGGDVEIIDEGSFAGAFETRTLGDLRWTRTSSRTFRFLRGRDRTQKVPVEHVMVNLVAGGRVHGRIGRRTISLATGGVVFSRLSNPMDLIVEEATWLALIIPMSILSTGLNWSPRFDGCVFDAGTTQASIVGGLLSSLDQIDETLEAAEITCLTLTSIAMIASCLGQALPLPSKPKKDVVDLQPSIRRYIVDNLSEPDLGQEQLCRAFELSRAQLYRCMKGTSDIAKTIRRLRLFAIRRDILSAECQGETIPAIARRWGLGDERNFRRAFVNEFGYPPSRLRNWGNSLAERVGEGTGLGFDLEQWMLGAQPKININIP